MLTKEIKEHLNDGKIYLTHGLQYSMQEINNKKRYKCSFYFRFFGKGAKIIKWKNEQTFQQMLLQQLDIYMPKQKKIIKSHTYYININTQ